MRVTILCSELSGYMISCWEALHTLHGVELLVYHYGAADDAPFQFGQLEWIRHRLPRRGASVSEMTRRLEEFKPDAMFMSGWMDKGYLGVARAMRRRGVPVIAGVDTQWRRTLRQQLATLLSRWLLHPAIDVLWVAGDRQAEFARRLGYRGSRCWRGVYACDWDKFNRNPEAEFPPARPAFIFVGRYVAEKGLADLLAAYHHYREQATEPWDLVCVGSGPLADQLRGRTGVEDLGFLQPDLLPEIFRTRGGAMVLPSRVEPWGVVVQEAAASGLPLICSSASGAAVHLLQQGWNGWLHEPGDVPGLARCLEQMSSASVGQLREMGRRSHSLSSALTPWGWAETLVEGVRKFHVESSPSGRSSKEA